MYVGVVVLRSDVVGLVMVCLYLHMKLIEHDVDV